MKALYLHGLGSGPDGFKPTFLRRNGLDVTAPALPDDDFARSVEIAQVAFDAGDFDVVIGSSRGGAVAVAIDLRGTPCVLIAPAWRRLEVTPRVGLRTIVLHSPQDDVIPPADSRELIERAGLPGDALVEVGDRHTMTDAEALAALLAAINRLVPSEGV